jgi:prepilin-type N-terminal cleavage/methylation domain-containing protein
MKNSQGGFTLVEIAIVLVIIGLLLGGVLKGQELITQAKIRNVANDLNGMSAAVYGYQDRYKKFPGDDNDAATRWASATPKPISGDGNGAVGGDGIAERLKCEGADAEGENCQFWKHLRLSGFVGGDSNSALAPQNAAGGVLQAQNGALGLAALTICSTNLSGKIANAIDAQFDDGKPNTGLVRGTSNAKGLNGTGDAAYVDDGSTVYVVCKTL